MKLLRLPIAAAALALSSCFTPAPPEPIHYVIPQAGDPPASAPAPRTDLVPLRLGFVRAAPHLREKIVWRVSDVEIGFYETKRWGAAPGHLVRRALERELFEKRGVPRVETLASYGLEAELLAFDDQLAPTRAALVRLVVQLFDPDGRGILTETYERREPISGDDLTSFARAASAALQQVTTAAADGIEAALRKAHH